MLAPRPTKLRSQRDINLWRIPLQLSLVAVALFGITLIPDILDKNGVIKNDFVYGKDSAIFEGTAPLFSEIDKLLAAK